MIQCDPQTSGAGKQEAPKGITMERTTRVRIDPIGAPFSKNWGTGGGVQSHKPVLDRETWPFVMIDKVERLQTNERI